MRGALPLAILFINMIDEYEVTNMNDLLNQIDLIQEMTDDAEFDVMMSLSDVYTKQLILMESCNETTSAELYNIYMEDGESSDAVVTKRNLKEKIIHFIKQLWRQIVAIFSKVKIAVLIDLAIKELKKLTRYDSVRFPVKQEILDSFFNLMKKIDGPKFLKSSEYTRDQSIQKIIEDLKSMNASLEKLDKEAAKAEKPDGKSPRTIRVFDVNPEDAIKYLEMQKEHYNIFLKNTMYISKFIDNLKITQEDLDKNNGTSESINELKNASNSYYRMMLSETKRLQKLCLDTKAVLTNKNKDAIIYTDKDRDMLVLIHLLATITNKTNDFLNS